jgi:signal recognition particle subunit SRP54
VFESLSSKLQNITAKMRGKARVTDADIKDMMREIRMALLEADVNYGVVKEFVADMSEKCKGADVTKSLTPGQEIVKIVRESLTELLGGEAGSDKLLSSSTGFNTIILYGLQGAGKTTTAAKLAGKLKLKGKKCLLVAADVYRPAAIKQLEMNANKQEVDFFSMGDKNSPVDISKAAIEHAAKNGHNVVFIDTAGRLQIDDEMMQELQDIKSNVEVHQTLLVVDAMTGQEAVNVAKTFDEKIGVDGVILSKMDGDARGGAALSVKAVTGKPILYVGMGEKLSDLEQFYPDRMANRILGMGDVLSFIEKAQNAIDIDEQKEREMASRMKKGKFDFNDYLESMKQMRHMGGLASIMGMLPGMGMGIKTKDLEGAIDEKQLAQTEAIVLSMTKAERENPKLLNPSRKHRIAKGAGVDIAVVNRFIKQFEQSQKMMKQMQGMMGKKGKFRLPF